MVDTLRITESPRYLHHNGRPLVAIWGFGFVDRPATPAAASELIELFKNHSDPRYRVTLFGGVPARWRTLTRDSKAEPEWARVYRSFDVISPWTVGRFRDDEGVERFYREQVAPDLIETRQAGLEYVPVTFPGFSWRNMNPDARFNQIPRRGGRFFWRQVEQALASGATTLYRAMFDEVDEGTAMFKIREHGARRTGRRGHGDAGCRRRAAAERLVSTARARGTEKTLGCPLSPRDPRSAGSRVGM